MYVIQTNYKCDDPNSPPIHAFAMDNIVGVTFTTLDIEGHNTTKFANSWACEKAQNLVACNGMLSGIVVQSNFLQA
jgi:hypothetical protein